eukprot:2461409-Amphidinium_carterae.2
MPRDKHPEPTVLGMTRSGTGVKTWFKPQRKRFGWSSARSLRESHAAARSTAKLGTSFLKF